MTQRYKPIVIGTSAIKLDLNGGGLYDSIMKAQRNLKKQADSNESDILPYQQSIAVIQQIYLTLTKREAISLAGVEISFMSDEWDFTKKYKPGKEISNYRFKFDLLGKQKILLSDHLKTILKLFTIYIITEDGLDCGSNKGRFNEIKNLMLYMVEKEIYHIEALCLDDLKDYCSRRDILYRTMVGKRRTVQKFLVFFSFLTGHVVYTKDIEEWCKDIDTDKINAHIAENKTVCPPTVFYQKFCEYHYHQVFDESVRKIERGLSGLLFIGSQTGLRSSELTLLKEDCIEVFRLDSKGGLSRLPSDKLGAVSISDKPDPDIKYAGILHYRSTKNGGRRGNVYTDGETNASHKVIRVILELHKLFECERKTHNTDALVPNEEPNACHKRFGYIPYIKEQRLSIHCKTSCIRNAAAFDLIDSPEADCFAGSVTYLMDDSGELRRNQVSTIKDMEQGGVCPGQTVSYITIKQFRVYVASDLHARGVDDRTISTLFNHHSSEMWGYYVRESHPIQEDIDFSREIVAEVVRDHTKILGPKGEAYERRIEEIIEHHQLNVKKDIDEVIDVVCGEMPIRAKVGGFCMMTNPDRDCNFDGPTDEFMCAYGCCPNHCHMYFMAPVTLQKARSIAEAIEYNLMSEFTNAAEKEAFKLKACIDNELLIELQELLNEVDSQGPGRVTGRHPETVEVLENLTSIYEEIAKWEKQIEQIQMTAR